MSDDGIPDTYPPSRKVPDWCASCGTGILVLTRTWEFMGSFWGKVYCANLCPRDGCQAAQVNAPGSIAEEIERRQGMLATAT